MNFRPTFFAVLVFFLGLSRNIEFSYFLSRFLPFFFNSKMYPFRHFSPLILAFSRSARDSLTFHCLFEGGIWRKWPLMLQCCFGEPATDGNIVGQHATSPILTRICTMAHRVYVLFFPLRLFFNSFPLLFVADFRFCRPQVGQCFAAP